jgi:hypothetical protein
VLRSKFSEVEALTLYLMIKLSEREVGGGKPDYRAADLDAWFDVMPATYHGVVMWSEQQLAHIQDHRVTSTIREVLKQFSVLSAKIAQLLAGAPASARAKMKLLQLPLHRQEHLFKTATCIIQSRAFGDFRLTPVMDMFNFSPHSNMAPTWRENVEGFTGYVLSADRDYDVGEEMLMFYGPKGNHNLIEMYGFSLLDNPFNCAMLYPKFFDKYLVVKNRIARMLGVDLDYGICVNAHMLSPALYSVSAIALIDAESMPRSEFLRIAAAPHTNPPLMAKVLHNLVEGLQASFFAIRLYLPVSSTLCVCSSPLSPPSPALQHTRLRFRSPHNPPTTPLLAGSG